MKISHLIKKTGLVLLLIPSLYSLASTENYTQKNLHLHPYWSRLLHYKTSWLGKNRSLVDRPDFFLHPNGKTDSEAELQENIQAFLNPESNAQCMFPERYRFIKKALTLPFQDRKCQELDEWKKNLNADSVTLIFSSAYAHAPASLFGHTFLRLNREKTTREKKIDLLDYGVNFAASANADTENAILYALKGLFGGYPGYFSLAPYYSKINEYTFVESRDMWEFDLSLSKSEVDQIVNHLWELIHHSHFDYYYLDENCSYQLLSLLEIAKPEWNLTNFSIYALPLDTVQRVADLEAFSQVRYRPSLKKILREKTRALTSEEKSRFQSIALDLKEPEASDSIQTLDAANSYFFYKKQRNRGQLSPEQSQMMKKTLSARSQKKTPTETSLHPSAPIPISPLQGHHPFRSSLLTGQQDSRWFQGIKFRFGIHDLMNSELGYTEFSQIEVLDLDFRYYFSNQKFRLENLEVFNAISLFPISRLEQLPSWKVAAKYTTPRDLLDCPSNCHSWVVSGAVGATTEFFWDHSIVSLLATGMLEAVPGKIPLRGGPGLEAFALLKVFESQKTSLSGKIQSDLLQTERRKYFLSLEWIYAYALSAHWEARGTLQYRSMPAPQKDTSMEWNLGLSYFF